MHTLRQILFVSQIDLANALRSRRAIAMLLLYILAVLGATFVFCEAIEAMQARVGPVDTLAQAATSNSDIREGITRLVGDKGVAEQLMATPPLALYFGWLILTFGPLLVVVNSSDAIAAQVRTGEARFILFRAGRLPFMLGTLLSHGLMMVLGIVIGAVVALLTTAIKLGTGSILASAMSMTWIATGAACYSGAYLGLAVGVSQLVDSSAAARGLGFGAYIGLVIGAALLGSDWLVESSPNAFVSAVRWFFPQAHSLGLWRLTFFERLPSMLALVFLGSLYCLPGWLYFRRRDL